MNTFSLKEEKRNHFRHIRSERPSESDSLILLNALKLLNGLKESNSSESFIGIYWPLAGEIDLRPLLVKTSLKFALPFSHNDGRLSYHSWSGFSLGKDARGIPAPINSTSLLPQQLRLLLLPALAIDYSGIRLGYGGGYFDRLRCKPGWKSITSLIVLPEKCVSKDLLPRDEWDIPFDGWISEKGIHSF